MWKEEGMRRKERCKEIKKRAEVIEITIRVDVIEREKIRQKIKVCRNSIHWIHSSMEFLLWHL